MLIAVEQSIFNGVFLVGAILLVVSGTSKAARPLATVRAMRYLRIPSSTGLARSLGVLEFAIGISAALTGWAIPCIGAAVLYLGFTGFVLMSMAVGDRKVSCGCFGEVETPPTWMHVCLNILFASASMLVALNGHSGLIQQLRNSPMDGILLAGVVTVGTYMAIVALVYRAQWNDARFPDAGSRS
jgi:hypothetical protein